MFPDLITQGGPDEQLRCWHSRYLSNDNPQGRAQNSPADMDLVQKADNALWQDVVLRAVDYDHIEIHAKDGMVGLYGHVTSKTNRLQAEQAVRRVKGVQTISNRLVTDEELLSEVATALASLERTDRCKFFTGVSHGVVLLSGTVEDATTRVLAEQCVGRNPNVRGVINGVQIRGGPMDVAEPAFLQPTIGAELRFLDGMSGTVQQVIIDPDNRRVVAVTLRGRFADPWQVPSASYDDSSRPPERTLVLPLATVRHLTATSGFLNIRGTENDRYSEYHSDEFHVPPTDWRAPYPYCAAEVLFANPRPEQAIQLQQASTSPIAVAMAGTMLKDELLENDSLGG